MKRLLFLGLLLSLATSAHATTKSGIVEGVVFENPDPTTGEIIRFRRRARTGPYGHVAPGHLLATVQHRCSASRTPTDTSAAKKRKAASLTTPSWNQVLVWLREMDLLRRAEAA